MSDEPFARGSADQNGAVSASPTTEGVTTCRRALDALHAVIVPLTDRTFRGPEIYADDRDRSPNKYRIGVPSASPAPK